MFYGTFYNYNSQYVNNFRIDKANVANHVIYHLFALYSLYLNCLYKMALSVLYDKASTKLYVQRSIACTSLKMEFLSISSANQDLYITKARCLIHLSTLDLLASHSLWSALQIIASPFSIVCPANYGF